MEQSQPMEPNQALKDLRLLTMDALQGGNHDAVVMAMNFAALDMWLTKGGPLPKAWQAENNCPECHRPAAGGHKMDCSVGRA